MPIIWLYNTIRKQLQKRRAGNVDGAQPQAGSQGATTLDATGRDEPSTGRKMSPETIRNLLLMAALAIPVFLETLDYTGGSFVNLRWYVTELAAEYFSCRNGPGSYSGTFNVIPTWLPFH
jgi:hypothetical protein